MQFYAKEDDGRNTCVSYRLQTTAVAPAIFVTPFTALNPSVVRAKPGQYQHSTNKETLSHDIRYTIVFDGARVP